MQGTGRPLLAILSAGSVLLFAGCVLLVSEPSRGTACRFSGAQSACGACVSTRCQASVNACCKDDACQDTLSALDGCASKNDESCNALGASAASLQPTSAELGKCITRRCAGECQPLAPASQSQTGCKELVLAPGASCSCLTSAEHNDFTCSEAVFAGARCCASKGWPGAGLACSCKHLQCNPTERGCFCSLVDYTPDQEECSGAVCCVSPNAAECSCRTQPCYADEMRVSSCSAALVGCGPQDRVDSCSRRSP